MKIIYAKVKVLRKCKRRIVIFGIVKSQLTPGLRQQALINKGDTIYNL